MNNCQRAGGSLPAGILFDLDDTLLDFSSSAERCWDGACRQFSGQLGGTEPAQLLAAINDYRRWYWSDPARHRRGRLNLAAARREVVEGALLRLGVEHATLADQVAAAYIIAREAAICLVPEAIATLQGLRAADVRLALITNGRGEDQRRKIERFALAPWFDCILVEGELGVGKPDPRIYRRALAALCLTPDQSWMVGDNLEWEVAAPQRLGITGVWYDPAAAGLPADCAVRPDRVIRRLGELLEK